MKKSTLITTIAMIVVVVVALSTATFAWFSSATEATATKSITTQASADWTLTRGTVTMPTFPDTTKAATVNYGGTGTNSITLDGASTSMLEGLFAPSAVIETALSSGGISANISKLPTFYEAAISGTKVNLTAKYDGTSEGTMYLKPDAIRVTNAKPETKTLILNITIKVGQDQGNGINLYAGAAVRFYICYAYGSTPTKGTINNAYNHASVDSINADSEITASNTAAPETGIGSGATIAYENATASGTWAAADAPKADLGINTGDLYKTYPVVIGTFASKASCNFLIYTWIDGWNAGTEAAGASVDIIYGFTTQQPVSG